MRRKISVFIIALVMMAVTLLPLGMQSAPVQKVDAEEKNLICAIFPFIGQIDLTKGLCGEDAGGSVDTIGQWLRFLLSLVFIGIILIAVVSIIKSAIEYIRSEGEEGKVEAASKAIKAVFIGIGALIVGLVGLAIVLVVVGGTETLNRPDDAPPAAQNFLNVLTE